MAFVASDKSSGHGGRGGGCGSRDDVRAGTARPGTAGAAGHRRQVVRHLEQFQPVLKLIREKYAIDSDRIYLMGHSMGGAGTYYLGGKYNDVWAGLAVISGAGGIAEGAAERYRSLPTLIMHGAKDSIVPPATSRRAAAALQAVGAPHIHSSSPTKITSSGFAAALRRWKKCFSSSAWSRSGRPSCRPGSTRGYGNRYVPPVVSTNTANER
jgi:pimeloyl-ACP methyl ester carboxylesterase